MSIFNVDSPNEFKVRFKSVIGEDLYQKNDLTGEYERVLTASSSPEPITLPYYLKTNSIKVTGEGGSETLVTSNLISTKASEVTTSVSPSAVSVENFGNSTGSELSSTALTFGDTAGNVSLTKAGVDTVSRLQTSETATALVNATGTNPIVYNPITKAFNQSRALQLLSADGNYRTNITTASFRNDMPNNSARFFMSGISSGVTHNEVNYRLYAGAFSSGIVHRNLNTNKGIVAKEDSFTVGDMNFDAISTTGNYGKLAETSLSFKDSSGTVVLDKGDVGVTNKLKALTAATSGANSKMLIYDTGTSAFNYTDIPSGGGGTVPAWVETDRGYFQKVVSMDGTYRGDYTHETKITAARTGGVNYTALATADGFANTKTTGSGSIETLSLSHDGLAITERVNAGASPITTYLTLEDLKSIKSQFTSWAAPSSSSWTAQNPASVSGGIITGYTNTLYRFPTMNRVGNTHWVDLGTWALPILTGAANARGFCIQLGVHDLTPSPTVSVSYSKTDLAISWENVHVRRDSSSTQYRTVFIKLQNNGGSTVTANGVVRIKIEAPSTIDYSSIISTTPNR
jgi:hypothetical protein